MRSSWIVAFVLFCGTELLAQNRAGSVYGRTIDETGRELPGVTLTLSGTAGRKVRVSDENGTFRFLQLDPDEYSLAGELEGFARVVYPNLRIHAGVNVSFDLRFALLHEERITVTDQAPLLDRRKIEHGTTLDGLYLERAPSARDPWSLLSSVPGVLVDRVNVGGNESGQQARFVGPGALTRDNNYAIDGGQVTEMASIASPGYYDFDEIAEVRVTTGGADVALISSGVTMNVVIKRGTDSLRGSARIFGTDKSLQSEAHVPESQFGAGQSRIATNQIRSIYDGGIELGGPIRRQRSWFWGAWAKNQIDQNAASGGRDDTSLNTAALKLNAQPSPASALVAWFNRSEKTKSGRGAGPTRAAETKWNQSGVSDIFKLEGSHIFAPGLFVSSFYSRTREPFELIPRGGVLTETAQGSDGVFRGSFQTLQLDFTSQEAQVEGLGFVQSGRVSHELKLGGRHRRFEGTARGGWPGGRDLVDIAGTNFGLPDGPQDIFFLNRFVSSGNLHYTSAWLQDTLSFAQWTMNAGIRADRQSATNDAVSVPANPVLPVIFPALNLSRDHAGGFVWNDFQPRIGLTYAPRTDTLVRVSFSQFAQQLDGFLATRSNGLAYPGATAFFLFLDANGNNRYDGGETTQFLSGTNFDVLQPAVSPNRTDSHLRAARTRESIVEVERSFRSNVALRLSVTARTTDRISEERLLVHDFNSGGGAVRVATRDDYIADRVLTGSLPNGQSYSVPTYALRPGIRSSGGSLLTTGDRRQKYAGVSLSFARPLSGNWAAQGYLTRSKWNWRTGSEFARFDDPNDILNGGDNNGAIVAEQASISAGLDLKENVFLNSRWSFDLSGLLQVGHARKWGFDVAGDISGREGYPLPYYATFIGADRSSRQIQVTGAVDSFRAASLVTTNLALLRDFSARGMVFTFSLAAFNLLNNATVLQRDLKLNGRRADYLNEVTSPRIVRLGVRAQWK